MERISFILSVDSAGKITVINTLKHIMQNVPEIKVPDVDITKIPLVALTVADFKEAVDYKPRKKAEHTEEKEVQKEEFYTLMGDNSWRKVIAEPITKYGMELFIHFDNDVWKISHAEVGMSLASGRTKTECMQKLKELIDSKGMDFLNSRIEEVKRMIENRVREKNPRYNVA